MYTFDSRIRYSETDENTTLTAWALIDYFQDCSTFQTQDAGVGLDWLKAQGLAWILSAWQIDIFRLPRLYEYVRTGTVPYALKGFTGQRNYFMDAVRADGKSGDAERLAVANSFWVLMDMERMYPVRLTEEHIAAYTLDEKLPMEYLNRKIALSADAGGQKGEDIVIHRRHLDTNHHVNNGQYVRMALEAVLEQEAAVGRTKDVPVMEHISRLRVEYKKQARLNDVLIPVIYSRTDKETGRNVYAVDLQLNGESCCVTEIWA